MGRENLLPIYTLNIPSDGAVYSKNRRSKKPTNAERRNFMKTRISELNEKIHELRPVQHELEEKWSCANIDDDLKKKIDTLFTKNIDQHKNSIIKKNQMKLINLNGGSVKFSRPANGYVNLTSKQLTPDQEELLNMGLNCHILSRPRKFQKRTECEILLDDVNRLARKGEVTVEPTFKQEVIAEA